MSLMGLRVNGVNDENYIEETVVKTLKQGRPLGRGKG